MKFIVNGAEKTVSLKVWDNKENRLACGGADIFADIETGVQTDPRFTWSEEASAYICSAETYDELIEFWKEETSRYNVRERSWFTENLDEDEEAEEFAKDLEYLFDYD